MNKELPGSDLPTIPVDNYLGFSQRELACIHLQIPESGTPWLDELIGKKQRQSIAEKVIAAFIENSPVPEDWAVQKGLSFTDTLLNELNKK